MRFAWTKGKMHYKDKLSHVYDIIHSNFPDYSKYNYTKNWYLLVFIIPLILNISNITTKFAFIETKNQARVFAWSNCLVFNSSF
jgi:hypothetical protein